MYKNDLILVVTKQRKLYMFIPNIYICHKNYNTTNQTDDIYSISQVISTLKERP